MLFHAAIARPYKFKNLMELLLNNLDAACFRITADGMFLHDHQGGAIVTATLPRDRFIEYEFNHHEPVYVGLGQNLAADLKSLKNKSKVRFSVERYPADAEPLIFRIDVSPPEGGELQVSLILTADQTRRTGAPEHPLYTQTAVEIAASDFAAVCRAFKPGRMTVSRIDGRLILSTGTGGVKVKEYAFGEESLTDDFMSHFSITTEKMLRLSKIAAFAGKRLGVLTSDHAMTLQADGEIGHVTATVLASV